MSTCIRYDVCVFSHPCDYSAILYWTGTICIQLLGCCRGLTALHASGPDVCHRDIKSMNFLVDGQFTAKVADLELGVSTDKDSSSGGGGGGGEAPREVTDILANW